MNITITGTTFDHIIPVYKELMRKTHRKYYQSQAVLGVIGAVTLASGLLQESASVSFWNLYTTMGIVALAVAWIGFSLTQRGYRNGMDNCRKVVAHKNALNQEWKLFIAEDHITYKDGETDNEFLWSCFESFTELTEAIIVQSYNASTSGMLVHRSMITPAEYDQFRQFCEQHLEKK